MVVTLVTLAVTLPFVLGRMGYATLRLPIAVCHDPACFTVGAGVLIWVGDLLAYRGLRFFAELWRGACRAPFRIRIERE